MDEPSRGPGFGRPIGGLATAIVILLACAAPLWLFLDPLTHYRLQTDDFAYVAGSRTWERTVSNLFVPHNTHIVPSWRLVCYGVVKAAGSLPSLPDVMAPASYGVLVAVMLAAGRLVAVETGRSSAGLLALVCIGSTSTMEAAGTWLSASQTLWAALGILIALLLVQAWTRGAGLWALLASIVVGWIAAGFWTLGHLSGVAGAAYLSGDPDPRRRRWSVVPLAGSVASVAVQAAYQAAELGTEVRVDGLPVNEAFSLVRGFLHACQAVPENLVLGNLGLNATTTAGQGVLLTFSLLACWIGSLRLSRRGPSPLERVGIVLIVLSYLAEFGFRGYKPFSELRGVAVPWYHAIPHVGLVLLLAGWWSGGTARRGPDRVAPPRLSAAAGVLAIQAVLLLLNVPRVQTLWDGNLAPMTVEEMQRIHIDPAYRRVRARRMAGEWASRQRRDLARLGRAEREARTLGIDRASIRRAFGRVSIWELPRQYDAADMLDLPAGRGDRDPREVREALGAWLDPPEGS